MHNPKAQASCKLETNSIGIAAKPIITMSCLFIYLFLFHILHWLLLKNEKNPSISCVTGSTYIITYYIVTNKATLSKGFFMKITSVRAT